MDLLSRIDSDVRVSEKPGNESPTLPRLRSKGSVRDSIQAARKSSSVSSMAPRKTSKSVNKKQGTSYNFQNNDLEQVLFDEGEVRTTIFQSLVIKSQSGLAILHLSTAKKQAIEFMKALSTAHECMVDQNSRRKDFAELAYQGPSPDEVTLVEFAQRHGYEMVNQNDTVVQVQRKILTSATAEEEVWQKKELLEFRVIKRIEFSSERKRMSILLQDTQDGLFKLYIKGADNVILDRLDEGLNDPRLIKATEKFLNAASRQGFRTLLVAMRLLDLEEAEQFA